jgi:hypothetical protein
MDLGWWRFHIKNEFFGGDITCSAGGDVTWIS